jgi:hypothetical protein
MLTVCYRPEAVARENICEAYKNPSSRMIPIWAFTDHTSKGSMIAHFIKNIGHGLRLYWIERVALHPIRWFLLLISFFAIEAILISAASDEIALAWLVIGLAIFFGGVSSLQKVVRCLNCGFLIAPAPTYRKPCPACGRPVQP